MNSTEFRPVAGIAIVGRNRYGVPPDENLQHADRHAMNRKLGDVVVFGLADHHDRHPPYENDSYEVAICRINGGFGCWMGLTFFTVNLLQRRLETLVRYMDVLRTAVRVARPFHIDAWVVLPDHMHCVWTLPP